MRIRSAVLLGVCLCVCGVAPSPAAVSFAEPGAGRAARQALPPSGRALVYVYRPADGGPEESPVLVLNNHAIGRLARDSFYYWSVAPDTTSLAIDGQPARSLTLRCEAGRIYFVRLTTGRAGDAELHQVAYGVGRKELQQARLLSPVQPAATRAPAASTATAATKAETTAAAPSGQPAAAAPGGFNLIVKGGSYSLGSNTQDVTAGATTFAVSFESSAPIFGVEGEWMFDNGWAVGGELLVQRHSYTDLPALPDGKGDMTATKFLVNGKKYFRVANVVRPFVGGGLGFAVVNMSGDINGTGTGFAAQALGGVLFQWQTFGIYTEVAYQTAESNGVDTGGLGLFAGANFHF